jgi:hypothetical protein
MNPIEYNGQSYGIIRGSDVQRDGMYLELWSAQNPDKQLCEVFYSDVKYTMSLACFDQEDIPIEVFEEYLRQSRYLLTPSQNEKAEQGAPQNP